MAKRANHNPPDRKRQFELIEVARNTAFAWARAEEIPLEHIEFIVPFVETDFSLRAVFFYATRAQARIAEGNGVSRRLAEKFKEALRDAGYPDDWSRLVGCSFASKQEVDEDYEGSYFYFLR